MRVVMALGMNNEFGKGRGLPWPKNADDMQFFKVATRGTALIMGRRTFESIGKPLRGRPSLVVSASRTAPNFFPSLNEAVTHAYDIGRQSCVIGGISLIQEAFGHPTLETIFITRFDNVYPEADVIFPETLIRGFKEHSITYLHGEVPLKFISLIRSEDPSDTYTIAPERGLSR